MSTEEDVSGVFKDLHISVFSKAASISSFTDSKRSSPIEIIEDDFQNTEEKNATKYCNIGPLSTHWATHNSTDNTQQQHRDSHQAKSECLIELRNNLKNCDEKNKNINKKDDSLINNNTISNKSNFSNISNFNGHYESMTSLNKSFAPAKLLYFCEMQRYLTVEKVMMERIQNMHESDKLIHNSLKHLKQTRLEEANTKWLLLEQRILDDIHEQEMKNRPKREAQMAADRLKNSQRVLERIQRIRDAENEARMKSEAILLNEKRKAKIMQCQNDYTQQYRDIMQIISPSDSPNLLTEKLHLMSDFKNCCSQCESLFKKCQTDDVTEEDVSESVKLLYMFKDICKEISQAIKTVNSESDKLEDVKVENYEEKTVPENKDENSDQLDKNGTNDCFDIKSLETYFKLKENLENYDKTFKDLLENPSLKKFRFNCQKAVTIPVNAISPVSSSHLSDKYFKLHNLLSGKTVDVGGVQVSASEHPHGISYCKKLLAKKFVRQGDLTVSSKPDAAFSIAAVLASLWIDFPDFGELVLAHFQSACPYLAPVFLPQVEGQSIEDYHKSLGYHYNENGEVEKQDSFLRRMSGIMRLYSAILISKVRQPGKANPLGISEGWRWMAALLNLEPKPDICATLLFDFLEVAGSTMFSTYGVQFKKLLVYICHIYFPKLEKVTPASSGGPIMRLEAFLQKIMKSETIPPPEGLLPPNFW